MIHDFRLVNLALIVTTGCMMSITHADTITQYYRPFTKTQKQADLIVVAKKRGTCLSQSQRIKRDDAWRCKVDDRMYDPCFVNPNGQLNSVICPESPWSGKSIEIELATTLNMTGFAALDMSRTYPWAVELINGTQCQALSSAKQFDDQPIHYQCNPDLFLFGHLQRCQSDWKILAHSPAGIEMVQVAKAWF